MSASSSGVQSDRVMIPQEGYLTRAELAEHLAVSEKTIARWQAAGMAF
jgi:hypothetical protein